MFHDIGVVARPDRKKALDLAMNLVTHLENKGLNVLLEPKLAQYANQPNASLPLEKMKTDLIITVGGDGTVLRTCLLIPKPEPPILAINMGVRGFLTEVPPILGIEALDECLTGKFKLETCVKLASFIGGIRQPDALNDVFVSGPLAKTLYTQIIKNGEFVARCQSDGVVVASQVGSTGYSLSGGGPVLDPEVNAFVLTPICPITGFHPIVFSTKSTIEIEILKPKVATVVIDGHYQTEIGPQHPRITIKKSRHVTSFVRLKGNFYRRLNDRLLLYKGGPFNIDEKENTHS